MGSIVEVPLTLSVADMDDGTEGATKSTRVDGDNDGILSDIVNLLAIQFDGVDDDSEVIYTEYYDDMGRDPTLKLNETEDPCIVLFIANAFGEMPVTKGMTLSYVRSCSSELSGGILSETTNGILYDSKLIKTDDSGNKYFMMSDSYTFTDGVSISTIIYVNMRRNVARVTLNVHNDQWDGGEITNVGIKSVPTSNLYYANQIKEDDAMLVPKTVSGTVNYINSASVSPSTSTSYSVTYYMPVNMRGTVEYADALTKCSYAPDGASYAYIQASSDELEVEYSYLIYKFYLGANLTTDYNLRPNACYEYDFTFNGQGDLDDPRITVVEPFISDNYIDYTILKSSNCYILNPEDEAVTYCIPIAPRVNEYWTKYANLSAKGITDGNLDSWDFELLWYDNDTYPLFVGSDDESSDYDAIYIEKVLMGEEANTPSLAITLPASYANMGNVLIAVRDVVTQEILWSWHLWVTDYCPYDHNLTETATGSYPLINNTGSLHRYNGTVWESGGIYETKYMMDRYIGARSSRPTDSKGMLYYQFGRKDPFPATGNAKTSNGSTFTTGVGARPVTMETSIANPTTGYVGNGDWCSSYTELSYLWHDENCSLASGSKSIFDPSPYGFRLPVIGAFNSPVSGSLVSLGTSGQAGFGYYLCGDTELFLPACGYLVAGTFGYSYLWSYTIVDTATPFSSTHCSALVKSNLSWSEKLMLCSGASLLCIEDE